MIGERNRLEQRQAEVEIGDRQADGAVGIRIIVQVEQAVAVAVRVTHSNKGIDVARANGQDIDRLARAISQHDRLRGIALDEFEIAADVHEVIDDDGHGTVRANHVGRVVKGDRRRLEGTRAIRIDPGLHDKAAVRRKTRAGLEIQGLGRARGVLAAIDIDREEIRADGDSIYADNLGAAFGMDRVIAARIGSGT